MKERKPRPQVLVLGLGNLLCGDDGLGIEAVRRLQDEYELPPAVEAYDGGTLGLALMSLLADADDVILVDAVRADLPAGSLVRLEREQIGPAARTRLSPHQVGVADLLDGLSWIDAYPEKMVLLGLVPQTLELGVARSESVEAALPELLREVVGELAQRGTPAVAREGHENRTPGSRDGAGRPLRS